MEWLLAKYEENLDLKKAPDKRKYSDVALKLLSYVKDEVERASYEDKVAKKLGVEVKVLREKGERLQRKIDEKPKRYLKKPKTEVAKSDRLVKLENSLLALKIFGGVTGVDIPFEVPEDEVRLSELEMIFNQEHEMEGGDLEKEAKELVKRYIGELNRHKIKELSLQLKEMDEDDAKYEKILKKIQELQTVE